MKTKWPLFSATFVLCLSILACNLPSKQETNAAATAIVLTFQAQTAQASLAQPSATSTQAAPSPTIPTTVSIPTQILPTSTPTGTFFVTTTGANCRSGPSQAYSILTTVPAGAYIVLVGRNNDNSWWYVQVNPSLDCWISKVVGYTTGNPGGVPMVAAPPLPTATPAPLAIAGPTLSDPAAISAEVSYPMSCTSNILQLAIRVADNGNGVDSVWLQYRYHTGSYKGNWHTVMPNDNASGGINGFSYPIGAEAASELGTQNGTVQYQFFAKDKSGNTSSYPSGSSLEIPIKYCP